MGILDLLFGKKCSDCGNRGELHSRNPPLCDNCYARHHRSETKNKKQFPCECGRKFSSGHALGGHRKFCKRRR